jgi:PRTRC genetic system protein B
MAGLRELTKLLGKRCPVEVFSQQVLARTPDMLAWWTPAASQTMFFRAQSELADVSGKLFPHPALLFAVSYGVLHVRALAASSRPSNDAMLAAAPYWNIDDNGAECAGIMHMPVSLTVTSILSSQGDTAATVLLNKPKGVRRALAA